MHAPQEAMEADATAFSASLDELKRVEEKSERMVRDAHKKKEALLHKARADAVKLLEEAEKKGELERERVLAAASQDVDAEVDAIVAAAEKRAKELRAASSKDLAKTLAQLVLK